MVQRIRIKITDQREDANNVEIIEYDRINGYFIFI